MRLGFSFRPSSHVTGLVLGLHMLCPSLHVGVSEHSAHSRPASYTRMNAPPPFNSISAAQRSASDLARPTVKPERKLPKVPCRRNTSLSGRMALKSSCVVASALPCRCQLQISLQISSTADITADIVRRCLCSALQVSTADITADIVRRCLCSALQVSTADITADIVTADIVRRCLCSALQMSTADITADIVNCRYHCRYRASLPLLCPAGVDCRNHCRYRHCRCRASLPLLCPAGVNCRYQ